MATYKIKLYYQTGNSLNTYNETDYLELTWENIDIAKENLQRIKEHYKMHNALRELYSNKKRPKIFLENKEKDWFVNVPKLFCISTNNAITEQTKEKLPKDDWEYRPDEYYAEHCIYIKADSGEEMQMTAYWCGYFERLHSAVIEVDNDDMKIEF